MFNKSENEMRERDGKREKRGGDRETYMRGDRKEGERYKVRRGEGGQNERRERGRQ